MNLRGPAARGREAEQAAALTWLHHLRGRRRADAGAADRRRRELALCEDEAGEHQTVEIALVEPVRDGDELLVHAGTAIA